MIVYILIAFIVLASVAFAAYRVIKRNREIKKFDARIKKIIADADRKVDPAIALSRQTQERLQAAKDRRMVSFSEENKRMQAVEYQRKANTPKKSQPTPVYNSNIESDPPAHNFGFMDFGGGVDTSSSPSYDDTTSFNDTPANDFGGGSGDGGGATDNW